MNTYARNIFSTLCPLTCCSCVRSIDAKVKHRHQLCGNVTGLDNLRELELYYSVCPTFYLIDFLFGVTT